MSRPAHPDDPATDTDPATDPAAPAPTDAAYGGLVTSFGSLNVDLAVRLVRHPGADETIAAHELGVFLGGKGANQATAAARLGAFTAMIGAVGDDEHGRMLRHGLQRNGVDIAFVETLGTTSGLAIPLVADDGDVRIVIVAGANGLVDSALAERARAHLCSTAVLLLQGELDSAASAAAAAVVRGAGGTVIFSPAPVRRDAALVAAHADLIIANRVEAAQLGLDQGRPDVVITLGEDGALVGGRPVPAFPAVVRDPTGAGDAFAAAVAVALARGVDLLEAVRHGCAAGACAVEIDGAEPSFPTAERLAARLATR